MLAPRRPATGPAVRVGETFRPDHVDMAGAEASRPPGRRDAVNLGIVAAVFPIIFLGELPDKTMFASLVLASRGRPRAVWIGAAGAFLVHAAIAVTLGAGLFAVLPPRAVDALAAGLFLACAVYAVMAGGRDRDA